ncbi:MAG: hypothetical protein QOD38_591, partial [Acidimicrobiaceae bacterium]
AQPMRVIAQPVGDLEVWAFTPQ